MIDNSNESKFNTIVSTLQYSCKWEWLCIRFQSNSDGKLGEKSTIGLPDQDISAIQRPLPDRTLF